jgi:hypothetical protein
MSDSELKAELSSIHSAHAAEIENLEKLCDSLREEHEVCLSLLLLLPPPSLSVSLSEVC